jgi:hypothetical protein
MRYPVRVLLSMLKNGLTAVTEPLAHVTPDHVLLFASAQTFPSHVLKYSSAADVWPCTGQSMDFY